MSLIGERDGFYDEDGHWVRMKRCLVDCGDRCTCKPPGGLLMRPGSKADFVEKEKRRKDELRPVLISLIRERFDALQNICEFRADYQVDEGDVCEHKYQCGVVTACAICNCPLLSDE